ncbi:MAG: SAM-dependent methyltransferase [Candidatus Melainabacteria bacterium]|nr:SAM-dependent methyltransferase [Candidatus Melainabacteria bacterium]
MRDPSGCVFTLNGQILRALGRTYEPHYRQLMQSGLYQVLTERNLLIPHEEIENVRELNVEMIPSVTPRTESQGFWLRSRIIKPERIPFISYPYEWCFGQLKDAALATLEVQRVALQHGMSLKDASAYNIQFYKGQPLLIDTGSFETYLEGAPWIAYSQFIRHFLAPLAVMSLCSLEMNKLLLCYPDGLPLELTTELLPWKTWLNPSLVTHLIGSNFARRAHLQKKSTGKITSDPAPKIRMPRAHLFALLDDLTSTIENLKIKAKQTEWNNYYQDNSYTEESAADKRATVVRFLDTLNPSTVWDVGANNGYFSKLSAERGALTISMDADIRCVEDNYQNQKKAGFANLLPLVVDMTVPPPPSGWSNKERMDLPSRGPADVTLALALVHHLAIAQNIPLKEIAACIAGFGQHLIIEFVPKNDVQVQRLLAHRQDIFEKYTQQKFEDYFSRYFKIDEQHSIPGCDRVLYRMSKLAPTAT